ncbi:MAG: hypothetical protein KDE48_21410 [Anaerolineales bacterium]|nr:hypothetical protein [Anaerolineales bacterium]
MNTIDLQDLERKAFRSNFQDGLWDIFLGLMLVQMCFGPILGGYYGLAPTTILLILLLYAAVVLGGFWYAKKYIILPRLGVVKFSQQRQKRRKRFKLVLSISVAWGVALFGIFLGLYQTGVPTNVTGPVILYGLAIVFGVGAVIVFSLMAYTMDFTRAYVYGWFYAFGVLSTFWLMEQGVFFPYGAVLLTAIMVLIGLVLFIRFLHEHPLQDR